MIEKFPFLGGSFNPFPKSLEIETDDRFVNKGKDCGLMQRSRKKIVFVIGRGALFLIFFVLNIINPYEKTKETSYQFLTEQVEDFEKQRFFEMLSEYILDGFKVAIIVCVMVMGYIAFLNLADAIFSSLFGISLRDILGYVFYPIAWVLNIHGNEVFLSSQIMGTKIVTNEFVAMQELAQHAKQLSAHTIAVVSVFLVSFANFASIGIIIGAIQALDKDASVKVARFSLKILYGAVLVSFLSANIVGFVISGT